MDVTTTTDVDVAADAALVYLEETATAGSGLFSSSHAAETDQVSSAVTDVDVTVDAITVVHGTITPAPGSGSSSFSSSVAAATTTVAANS